MLRGEGPNGDDSGPLCPAHHFLGSRHAAKNKVEADSGGHDDYRQAANPERAAPGCTPTEPALAGPATVDRLDHGSIIGVGIFSLPYSLASYGPISLVAMGLATVGAVALALMFAVMSRRLPADGGPYAYARSAFGNGLGFSNAWSYWITAWAGNAAIVVGWVYYVEHFLNKGSVVGWSIAIAVVGLWIPAVINLTGVRNMGAVQVWTTVLKFIPLALMSTVGLFFISSGNFTPWNVSGDSSLSAIGGAMAICLFSYLGVETAAVAAAKVRDPDRNIPKSTIYGTLASSAVYLLSDDRSLWHRAHRPAGHGCQQGVVLHGRQLDRRWGILGRQPRCPRRHRLRHRRSQRLDHDLRRDAAGRGEGWPLPQALRQPVEPERSGLRHHRLDRAGVVGRGDQLHGRPTVPRSSPPWC